jgi:hypothetical protein
MGGFIFTVSMPPSEAKMAGRYMQNKETFNYEHSTPNLEVMGRH